MKHVFIVVMKFNLFGFTGDGLPLLPAHRDAFATYAACVRITPEVAASLAKLPSQFQPKEIVCQRTAVRH